MQRCRGAVCDPPAMQTMNVNRWNTQYEVYTLIARR
jgi:hypothetical protein